jgi:hypothetical protein
LPGRPDLDFAESVLLTWESRLGGPNDIINAANFCASTSTSTSTPDYRSKANSGVTTSSVARGSFFAGPCYTLPP